MVGKTSLIDALLLPKNVTQKKGEIAKSTQLLHQAGIKRSFAGSHLQQVKHAMREGSIKLVTSQTTLGMNNELEGKKLDPHDHESVKLYLSAVGKINQNTTQGRGYLKAGLTTLDQIHKTLVDVKEEPPVIEESPVIEKCIGFDGDDTMESTYAFVKNLTTSKPGKLEMNMNGVCESLDMCWLHDEFFSVCDKCVDAGWDVEVHYEGERDYDRLLVGMYKNKIRSDQLYIFAESWKNSTEEEREAEADCFIRGLDVSLTAEDKKSLRQSCLATLDHCADYVNDRSDNDDDDD
jgi:hypothetical protein